MILKENYQITFFFQIKDLRGTIKNQSEPSYHTQQRSISSLKSFIIFSPHSLFHNLEEIFGKNLRERFFYKFMNKQKENLLSTKSLTLVIFSTENMTQINESDVKITRNFQGNTDQQLERGSKFDYSCTVMNRRIFLNCF